MAELPLSEADVHDLRNRVHLAEGVLAQIRALLRAEGTSTKELLGQIKVLRLRRNTRGSDEELTARREEHAMRDVALVDCERRHEELRQGHDALVAALDGIIAEMREEAHLLRTDTEADDVVRRIQVAQAAVMRRAADRLAAEVAKHREPSR